MVLGLTPGGTTRHIRIRNAILHRATSMQQNFHPLSRKVYTRKMKLQTGLIWVLSLTLLLVIMDSPVVRGFTLSWNEELEARYRDTFGSMEECDDYSSLIVVEDGR